MDVTFVLCPSLIGLMGLSILLIFTRFNFYLEKRKLKLFIAAALINMGIIIFEVGDYLLAEASFPSAYLLRRFSSATGYALTPLMPLLLAYIANKKPLSRLLPIPAIVTFVVSYASMFTGHVFFISPENSFIRGPLFYPVTAISCIYLLLLIYVSLRDLKDVQTSEAMFLLGIVAVMFITTLLEIAYSFHFIVWNSCAILLITYYLFLHIQYFKFDPLTNVYNRNMFMHDVENLYHRENVGIVSFDLNGLKGINDKLGHEQGDRYIINSSALINQCFRDAGRLYRVGGDEFVVILPGVSDTFVQQKIRAFNEACKRSDISVACGYAFNPQVTDASQMLRDADKAMYDCKRNRIMNR